MIFDVLSLTFFSGGITLKLESVASNEQHTAAKIYHNLLKIQEAEAISDGCLTNERDIKDVDNLHSLTRREEAIDPAGIR